jgi:hypothetical protein
MASKKADPRVDKRRVTMTNFGVAGVDDAGEPVIARTEVVDYVRPDVLDAYVADARTRWQQVTVSDEPDAGPGGYDGATHIPATLDHPLAGQTFPATEQEG